MYFLYENCLRVDFEYEGAVRVKKVPMRNTTMTKTRQYTQKLDLRTSHSKWKQFSRESWRRKHRKFYGLEKIKIQVLVERTNMI